MSKRHSLLESINHYSTLRQFNPAIGPLQYDTYQCLDPTLAGASAGCAQYNNLLRRSLSFLVVLALCASLRGLRCHNRSALSTPYCPPKGKGSRLPNEAAKINTDESTGHPSQISLSTSSRPSEPVSYCCIFAMSTEDKTQSTPTTSTLVPPGDHRKRRRNRTTQSCLNCHASKRMVRYNDNSIRV